MMNVLKPKFSIITVCYNADLTIENTLKSIFSQSYKNFETIVIDGMSTDNTINIIKKYKEKISNFISEKDSGIYNAMNKGLNFASGEYVFFLNANDSFYDEHVLENVAKILEECPQIDFLYGDSNYIEKDGKSSSIKRYNDFELKSYVFTSFLNINHQVIFYKKKLFDKFGMYDENIKLLADWDFNIRCLYKTNTIAKYVPIVISNFQLGGLSNCEATNEIDKLDRQIIKNKVNKKNNLLDKFLIKLDSFFYWHVGFIHKLVNPKRIFWWQFK